MVRQEIFSDLQNAWDGAIERQMANVPECHFFYETSHGRSGLAAVLDVIVVGIDDWSIGVADCRIGIDTCRICRDLVLPNPSVVLGRNPGGTAARRRQRAFVRAAPICARPSHEALTLDMRMHAVWGCQTTCGAHRT